MNQISEFRPNHLSPDQAQALLAAALTVRDTDYLPAFNALHFGRGVLAQRAAAGQEAAIGVYANMQSRYRRDQASLRAIESLPAWENSPESIRARMQLMSALWIKLPVPADAPKGSMAYLPWQGMNRAVFDALCDGLAAAQRALPLLEHELLQAETRLNQAQGRLAQFVSAAGSQARRQFPDAGWKRALLEGLPRMPSKEPPGPGTITSLKLLENHRALLAYEANRATSFVLRHKKPGETAFHVCAQGLITLSWTSQALAAGPHEFEVLGHNSLGDGESSAPVRITI